MMNTHSAVAQMNRLRDELDRVFNVDASLLARSGAFPPVNIWEDENGYYLEAELPGLSMEDVEIFIHDGDQLSIKGSRKPVEIEGVWHRHERGYGDFERTFKLADIVDVENVTAELEHGVLSVSLPKSEAVKPRKIVVKAAK